LSSFALVFNNFNKQEDDMMKKNTMTMALTASLLSISAVQAGEFSGGWLGAKVGSNRSDIAGAATAAIPTANSKTANTYGIEGGYNWDMSSNFLLGVDGFADFNQKSTHTATTATGALNYGSDVYGMDVKLGLPSGNWLPYAKLGYGSSRLTGGVATGSGSGAHLGLGVEYKFAPQWSVAGEYTTISDKFNNNTQKLRNKNLTIGLNYYFEKPYVAAVAAPVAAPVVVKQEVKPAPVVEPKPVFKTIFTDKPVTIEGANFATSSAKLNHTADKQLAEVVDFAVKNPESDLVVTGYTDSRGTSKYNQKLSEKRAESVKAYLVKQGVPADRIAAKGLGEANPIGDNKTRDGQAQNRRVEITSVIREASKVRVNN
jgi:OOP family OmpA-OmpF porin